MNKLYTISVVLTAISIFWPALYGSIEYLRKIPGNPVLQAVLGTMIFGLISYLIYEENNSTTKEELTAS